MALKSRVLSSLQGGLDLAKAKELPMVLVMGMTGAGKSHFINKLANRYVVEEGDDYDSCMSRFEDHLMQTSPGHVAEVETDVLTFPARFPLSVQAPRRAHQS
jgi:predicted GTPase